MTRLPELLDSAEACAFLGIELAELRRLRAGAEPPPSYRLSQGLRFEKSSLERWLEEFTAPARQTFRDEGSTSKDSYEVAAGAA